MVSHWLAWFQKAEVLSQAYSSDPLNVIQSTAFRVTWIASTSWCWVIGTTVTGPQSDSNGFWMLYLPRWLSLCRIYTQHSWLFQPSAAVYCRKASVSGSPQPVDFLGQAPPPTFLLMPLVSILWLHNIDILSLFLQQILTECLLYTRENAKG